MDLKAIKSLVINPSIIYRRFIAVGTFTGIIHCYVLIYLTLPKRKTAPATQVTALVQAKLQGRIAKTTALITMHVTVGINDFTCCSEQYPTNFSIFPSNIEIENA